ncbi:hypothetical protein D9M68_651630 [compost metagenome]
MERRGYRQQQRALGARRFGLFAGALDRGLVAGDHDLGGRVEVHGLDDLALGGGGAGGAHGVIVQAQDGGHSAGADRHGGLHGVGAHAHQAHSVFERERTGGRQRGVFTEAVPGHDIRLAAARGTPGGVHRNAGRQHRGLGVGGQVELLGRALRDQRAQVLPQGLRRPCHGLRDGRDARPGVQHADSLRTLAREDKSNFHG